MKLFIESFELLLKQLEKKGGKHELLSIIEGIVGNIGPARVITKNSIDLTSISNEKINELKVLMVQLDAINLYTEIQNMTVYYQVNADPRTPNTQSLYAKAVTPKFGKMGKRKHISIRYGSLNKYPEGWTQKNKTAAKHMLMQKALSQVLGA